MVCKNCGKEMVKIGELTEKEYEDLCYIDTLRVNSSQALNPQTIKEMEFSDGQIFEYFRAAFDSKAQAEFLSFIFWRNLKDRLNETREIFLGDEPYSKELFVHPTEE